MKIVVLCEGKTEKALRDALREFVQHASRGARRVGVDTRSLDGPMFRNKLAKIVELTLAKSDTAGVVALTDVYPNFDDAADAKEALRRCAGDAGSHEKFRVHAAQFELEAWILPFWDKIAKRLGVNASSPGARPEAVNGQKPPSFHLKELYKRAGTRYDKVIDTPKWLTAERLEAAAESCPELRAFLGSLLEFSNTQPLQ